MAYLRRDLVQAGTEHREGAQIGRVPVALQHLGRNGGRAQPQLLQDRRLVFRLQVTKGTYRPRQLAHPQVGGSGVEPAQVPPHFRVPKQQFQPKSRGFCMNSMGPADGRRVLELNCALAQSVAKPDNLSTNQARSLTQS